MIAGYTTVAEFAVPLGARKCDLAVWYERELADEGWAVSALETADAPGQGTIRDTIFDRGTANISLSMRGRPTNFTLSIDHKVKGEKNAESHPSPCTP